MNKSQYLEHLSYHWKLADKTRQKAYEEMQETFNHLKKPDEDFMPAIEKHGYQKFISLFNGHQLIEMFENELPDIYEFEYDIKMYSDHSDLIYPDNYDGFCDENYEEKDIEYLSHIILKYANKDNGKTIIITRKPNCHNNYKIIDRKDNEL